MRRAWTEEDFFFFLRKQSTKGGQKGLKEVNFKVRLVYRVTGYISTGRQIYTTSTLLRDQGGIQKIEEEGRRFGKEQNQKMHWYVQPACSVCVLFCIYTINVCVKVVQWIGHNYFVYDSMRTNLSEPTNLQTPAHKHAHTVFTFVSGVNTNSLRSPQTNITACYHHSSLRQTGHQSLLVCILTPAHTQCAHSYIHHY